MKDLRRWTKGCEVKDLTQGKKWINSTIERLIEDAQHRMGDEVCHECTFEEILGALAAGKAAIKELERLEKETGRKLF